MLSPLMDLDVSRVKAASFNILLHHNVKWSLAAAQNPSTLELKSLCQEDGKVTIIPWKADHSLIWDDTCSDTFQLIYNTQHAVRKAWAVVEEGEDNEEQEPGVGSHSHFRVGFGQGVWCLWS